MSFIECTFLLANRADTINFLYRKLKVFRSILTGRDGQFFQQAIDQPLGPFYVACCPATRGNHVLALWFEMKLRIKCCDSIKFRGRYIEPL